MTIDDPQTITIDDFNDALNDAGLQLTAYVWHSGGGINVWRVDLDAGRFACFGELDHGADTLTFDDPELNGCGAFDDDGEYVEGSDLTFNSVRELVAATRALLELSASRAE